MFAAGNLVSFVVIVSVMTQLLIVCFDDKYGNGDDNFARTRTRKRDSHNTTAHTKDTVFFTLMFGLVVEIIFAVVLSFTYRSPLDIKSVYHIPLEAFLSCGDYLLVFVLAPFSWAVIYLLGGTASRFLSIHSFGVEQGGSGLEHYLTISGMSMTLVGLMFLGISVVGLFCSFGSPARRTNGCCAAVCRIISQHILSTGLFLDIGWQLQGIVWSYRTGGFGLIMSVFVGMCGVVGTVLSAIGTLGPEKHDVVIPELPV